MKCTLRSKGKRHVCVIEADDSKLYFRKSPFAMKNEIKSMRGSRWNPDERMWTVANHPRNHFQLSAMMVEPTDPNPYAWFQRPLLNLDIKRPLAGQQVDMLRRWQTYHYQVAAADMGLGKSLTALELMERNPGHWIYVGPTSALESVRRDSVKWDSDAEFTPMTYERFRIDYQNFLEAPPLGIIFDECTALKNPQSLNARSAQAVSDRVREVHGTNGFVICMSGTTTAKRPSDIWSQAEVAYPGFAREGSLKAFESRYAIIEEGMDSDGVTFPVLAGWKEHEVEKIPARLSGLMTTYFRDDWLDLPEQTFEVRRCEPTSRIKRIASALAASAPNTITALTWLRALSSGFQYKDGETEGLDRSIVETNCPKDDVLRDILKEEESTGRMICFASFQGSIDRVRRICFERGWDVITIDGRGWNCYKDEEIVKEHVLDFWANNDKPTVLSGNPASCRFGLTLIEALTTVYFDQGFSAEHRLQSMARNYRMGQKHPVRVIDILHLPVDELILETLKENRRLEELSIGYIQEQLRDTVTEGP